MVRCFRRLVLCVLLAAAFRCGTVMADGSNRTAVPESPLSQVQNLTDMEQAKQYLNRSLPKVEKLANDTFTDETGYEIRFAVWELLEALRNRFGIN